MLLTAIGVLHRVFKCSTRSEVSGNTPGYSLYKLFYILKLPGFREPRERLKVPRKIVEDFKSLLKI